MEHPITQYRARVWRTEILLKEAEDKLDTMIMGLLPEYYEYKIEECDTEVPGFPHARHYKFCLKLTSKKDVPHFYTESYSKAGCKAKLLGILFEGQPCYPLT